MRFQGVFKTASASAAALSLTNPGNTVTRSWNPSSDAQRPARGLTYNVRIRPKSGVLELFRHPSRALHDQRRRTWRHERDVRAHQFLRRCLQRGIINQPCGLGTPWPRHAALSFHRHQRARPAAASLPPALAVNSKTLFAAWRLIAFNSTGKPPTCGSNVPDPLACLAGKRRLGLKQTAANRVALMRA